jgi:serine/threonine-protein kinase
MLPKLGRYEPIRKIAAGGMATVYLGRVVGEGGFERLVALKVMHPHIASDPDFVAMFLDEARLAARIRHNNVVSTIDIQKTDAAMFLVMEYVDGPTLQELRKHLKTRAERVPVGIVLRVFIDILSGLHEAHELRDNAGKPFHLVHRDVSPHNILIGRDGAAKLTDFGVARAEARLSMTRGGQLKGKIAYMAPEQILGEPIDRRSDVYAAGVCMWEALAGKRLFRAPNDGALVHLVLQGKPERAGQFQDVPPQVEAVVSKAISRQPGERFADALQMIEAIEAAAREADIAVPGTREVAKFIQRVATELERSPVQHTRSLTPPSGKAAPPKRKGALWGGRTVSSRPPAAAAPPDEEAAPISSAPETQRGMGSRAPARPRSAAQPPPPPIRRLSPAAMPAIRVEDTDDGGTSAPISTPSMDASQPSLPSGVQGLSQPSVVTQPTQTEAIYSLQPPPSRNGMVAIAVAGVILVGVIIAVVVGQPSKDDNPILITVAAPAEPTATATATASATAEGAPEELPIAFPTATVTATPTASASAEPAPRIPYRKQREDIYEP